ncbi:Asp-tRNAAsn/Glu-tRNAGln amidotransferase B subunit (PET112 homolog) [Faecalitalea cylindroides T2-87]|uniref:Asp-tRNAAsn/Glu-tRNAGln amidotransferase B subunit (PET112 homolog) n=1 Tax=Faecalitalea cylindroides T2-87 TaxID=717960 RepID=D4JCX9_9FIRM|nr:Asp-tRNAAsn/Glu-tRNAGln amidotransferase B subunit (PET112 homolog) [Faecalitalea cylindroides T2-87]
MDYYVTIGIEIHCELKTNTKMFSGAPVRFGKVANTCTSVVDLGHPGILPCVNKEAVRLAIKACTAMHCELDTLLNLIVKTIIIQIFQKDSKSHNNFIQSERMDM